MKESGFQFKRPYLKEIVFTGNEDFNKNENVQKVKLANILTISIKKDEQEPFAIVELRVEIKGKEAETPFVLKATIASQFRWSKTDDLDQVDRLLKVNAPALLTSYLRPIISQVVGFSKFPPYELPFLNFTEGVDSEENSD